MLGPQARAARRVGFDYVLDLDDGGEARGERLLIATRMGAPGSDGTSRAAGTDRHKSFRIHSAVGGTSHEPPIPASRGERLGWVLHPENRRGDERSGAEQFGDDEQGERKPTRGRFVIGSLGLGFGFHFVSVDRFRHARRHAFCVIAVSPSRVPVAPVEALGSLPGFSLRCTQSLDVMTISAARAYGWSSVARVS
jgi:hypothetical protein